MTLGQAKLALLQRISELQQALKALDSLTDYEGEGVSVQVRPVGGARVISPQARQRMALAQSRRWAKWHAEKAKHVKAAGAKRG